jgi:hypothetical protein
MPIALELINTITGHNVPSGAIYERQMWVQVAVTNENGDTVLESGMLDPLADLCNENSEYAQRKRLIPKDSLLVLFRGRSIIVWANRYRFSLMPMPL